VQITSATELLLRDMGGFSTKERNDLAAQVVKYDEIMRIIKLISTTVQIRKYGMTYCIFQTIENRGWVRLASNTLYIT
jgi:hypothetical protein